MKRFPAGRSVADHAEPPGFADSAFFNQWVRPQGYRRSVGALVERSDRHLVLMAYLRPARRGAFTEAESRRFDAVLPHVGRALRIARRLGAAEATRARLAAMLDALPADDAAIAAVAEAVETLSASEDFGVAYAIWSGVGLALVAIAGMVSSVSCASTSAGSRSFCVLSTSRSTPGMALTLPGFSEA